MSARIICPECDVDFTWDRCPSCGYVPPNPDVVHEDEAADEITRLRAERGALEAEATELRTDNETLAAEVMRMRKRVEELEEALEFYGDPEHYEVGGGQQVLGTLSINMGRVATDGGHLARRALRGETKDE